MQILSPKDGSRISQDQNSIFVSGKVARDGGRSANVDIFLVIDVSGSTLMYAGMNLGEADQPPDSSGFGMPQITIGGMSIGKPPVRNLRNSILAAEVAASRRLLLQLNSQTTRVGVLTFSEGAKLMQPLTQDFDQVRRILDDILRAGPYGGTNMVEGIRMAITELMGLGTSQRRTDAVKVQFLLTDGFPSLPIGGGKRAAPEDTDLAINAAQVWQAGLVSKFTYLHSAKRHSLIRAPRLASPKRAAGPTHQWCDRRMCSPRWRTYRQ